MNVSPLVFEPLVKPKIWGGRQLAHLFNKKLPASEPIGESWELADLEDDQSIVAGGTFKGRRLGELVTEWGSQLTGEAPLFEGRFPLLIKFLDANDTLSVQVHPDQAMADRRGGRVRLKNEAWYIIDAEESGLIYRGVKPGVDEARLRDAITDGRVESVLQRIPVKKGECYYLPSGSLHALGAGVVVAEVQTPSDITYRVFDWNRVDDKTGKPRELHVEQAMECIDFSGRPIAGEEESNIAGRWTSVTRLVTCESFLIDRVHMAAGQNRELPYNEMIIWIVLEGRGSIACSGCREPLLFSPGDTVLLPVRIEDGRLQTHEDCLWLEVAVPGRS